MPEKMFLAQTTVCDIRPMASLLMAIRELYAFLVSDFFTGVLRGFFLPALSDNTASIPQLKR